MSKYTYSIETRCLEAWHVIVRDTRDFCMGYLSRANESSPRNAFRLMRNDGKVMQEIEARSEVSVGQIAGYPTAEQYEGAAKRALDQAARIREQQVKHDARRNAITP